MRNYLPVVVLTALAGVVGPAGCHGYTAMKECRQGEYGGVVECRIEDCACERDDDCVIERCGFEPAQWPAPEELEELDGWCYFGSYCSGGYPLPGRVWEDLRSRWAEHCPDADCTIYNSDDVDCCVWCVLEPRCRDGLCVGIPTTESSWAFCSPPGP